MGKPRIQHAVLCCLSFLLMWSAAGCGRKGPPLPPSYQEPPAVANLRHQISDGKLTLRWSAPAAQNRQAGEIAATHLYRSKTALEDAACRDCPENFVLVEKMPFEPGEMTYMEKLESGFRYTYKVVLYGPGNREGADSNRVRFTYE